MTYEEIVALLAPLPRPGDLRRLALGHDAWKEAIEQAADHDRRAHTQAWSETAQGQSR